MMRTLTNDDNLTSNKLVWIPRYQRLRYAVAQWAVATTEDCEDGGRQVTAAAATDCLRHLPRTDGEWGCYRRRLHEGCTAAVQERTVCTPVSLDGRRRRCFLWRMSSSTRTVDGSDHAAAAAAAAAGGGGGGSSRLVVTVTSVRYADDFQTPSYWSRDETAAALSARKVRNHHAHAVPPSTTTSDHVYHHIRSRLPPHQITSTTTSDHIYHHLTSRLPPLTTSDHIYHHVRSHLPPHETTSTTTSDHIYHHIRPSFYLLFVAINWRLCFTRRLSVCLFVCVYFLPTHIYVKSTDRIIMKILPKMYLGQERCY